MHEFRVLVVDDERDFLETFVNRLRKRNLDVTGVESGEDAIALLDKQLFDVAIVDVKMPGMDGVEALREMKRKRPLMEVIMLTGHASVESGIEGMKIGAFDYIMKPIPLDDLKEKIDRVLEYKRFISSGDSLQTYRALHNEVLNLLENRDDLPQDKLREMLRTLGSNIDQVFGMQKEYETIIQVQADALKKIEGYVEILKDAVPKDSPYYELVKKIREESEKKI